MHRILACLGCALALGLAGRAAADSPAQTRIQAAQARIARAADGPERAAGQVALAAAETARARETGDASYYAHALEALARAREAEPGRDDLRKLEAWVRLGRHEFAAAEALARSHLRRHPDDPEAWGLLGDALMERGRTEEAGEAWQRMMDLRPGPGAYLRASYYRERRGDLAGAALLLERTLVATSSREPEQRAWILVQLASLEERQRRAPHAEALLGRALDAFPAYHYALAALAELHLRQGRPEPALSFARRALAAAPHAERWLTLADALRALGREAEARDAEDAFERAALANLDEPDNENVFLVDFYLDRRPDPTRALAIARREAARRPDPATLARLARAEQSSGLGAGLRGDPEGGDAL